MAFAGACGSPEIGILPDLAIGEFLQVTHYALVLSSLEQVEIYLLVLVKTKGYLLTGCGFFHHGV